MVVKELLKSDTNLVLDDFLNVRSDPTNKKGFFFFFDQIVTCVSGKKNWTPSAKVTEKLSECDKVTISDEAFAEIVLINYWDRWVDGKKTKYTDSRNGSLEFQGWGNKGHEEYNKIYKRIQNQRKNKRLNDLVDRIFLIQAKKEYEDIISIIQRNVVASKEVIEEICVDDF